MNEKEAEIMMEYEKLVYSIIKKYEHFYDKEDLYQVGMIGLMNAYRHFDPKYQVKFSTYAFSYIVGEVSKYIREDKSIKVSKDLLKLNKSIEKAKEVLSQKLMRIPTDSELALFLEIDESKIVEARSATDFVRSLDFCLTDEGKELNLYDSIRQEEKQYNANIMDLKDQIKTLTKEEQQLIASRYFEEMTQQETSERLGMSQVQVSRKENNILTKLKDKLCA